MGVLEDVAIAADRDRRLVIEIQGAEDRVEGYEGRTERWEISCIQLFLRL